MTRNNLLGYLRIVTAFALKDIRDAIQNKMILRIGIGTLMVWFSAMALPFLMSMRSTLALSIFDPGRTTLVRELAKAEGLDISRVRSEDELRQRVGGSFSQMLGLKVDPAIGSDEGLVANVIEGYYPHWMAPHDVAAMVTEVESQAETIGGGPITIDTNGGASFPSYDSVGQPTMISSSLVIVIFTVGGMLTPYLMVEEKERGTFAALMVSPAKQSQFVLGKAIAGLFYSLIVVAVALAMSARWIVHWDVAILAALAGSSFTVALGLLVGIFTENPSSMGLWFGLLLLVMLVPVFLEFTPAAGQLAWWQVLMQWMPSVGFADLIRSSFVQTVPSDVYIRGILSMLGTTTGLLVLVEWRVRALEM